MLDLLLNINPIVLAASAVVGFFAVALALLRRRRSRMEWVRRLEEAEESARSGETSALPLPELANAVEVLDLEELLQDEDGPVAAAARRQLERPTDISTGPDTMFPLPPRPAAPAAPPPPQRIEPTMSASAAAAVAAARRKDSTLPAGDGAVPVRELALAWFEARGYRASAASAAVRPIELVLRHRQDATRAYAFVVERERVSASRAVALSEHARSIGLNKLLVAAEAGFEQDARRQMRREGVRLVDQAEMQREFEKLEISVAAKIIAVARSRARIRRGAVTPLSQRERGRG